MRVLVLGGTKFIGRALVDELAAAGHEVIVVHRGSRSARTPPLTSTSIVANWQRTVERSLRCNRTPSSIRSP